LKCSKTILAKIETGELDPERIGSGIQYGDPTIRGNGNSNTNNVNIRNKQPQQQQRTSLLKPDCGCRT